MPQVTSNKLGITTTGNAYQDALNKAKSPTPLSAVPSTLLKTPSSPLSISTNTQTSTPATRTAPNSFGLNSSATSIAPIQSENSLTASRSTSPLSLGGQNTTGSQIASLYSTPAPAPSSPGLVPVSPAPKPQADASYNPGLTPTSTGYNPQTGATFNSAGGLMTPGNPQPQAPQQAQGTFPGLIKDIAGFGTTQNSQVTDSFKRAQELNERLAQSRRNQAGAEATNRLNPIPIGDQTGREAVIRNQYLAEQNALASEFEGQTNLYDSSLTGQKQQIDALTGAAGLTQPSLAGFNQQSFDPLTGQFGGGGGQINDAVSSVAQKIANGTLSYDAGLAELSPYGVQGTNALRSALGPNFNTQQSNAQAAAQSASTLQTGTLGGQLQKSAETVKQHMTTLKSAYEQLGAQYGFPILNRGVNAIGEALGSGPLQSYNIALSNVRDELAKILGGGSSTDSSRATARELLPDNMTPAQMNASIKTAQELMDSKIAEYTRTPGFNAGSSSGGAVVQTSAGPVSTNW